MELTKRLEAIAGFVDPDAIVADVGTDHGYIPIYLAQKGLTKKVYAMDINKGPLERARKNIVSQGVSDSVETILSDGLKALGNRKIDILIIAGMGGMLVKKILEDSKDLLPNIPKLILSPHLDVDAVRKTIHELGYRIEKEDFLEEDGKFYSILVCLKGYERYERTIEYKYGKKMLEVENSTFRKYLLKQKVSLEALLQHLNLSDTQASKKRIIEIMEELSEINEVIK